jgi:hypothetical protein
MTLWILEAVAHDAKTDLGSVLKADVIEALNEVC